jgi:predicted DNA-binding protein (MmcQ/YjbR family)
MRCYLCFTMTIEDIQGICKKYRGVTQDIKWEDHLCFNVGGKMFLITAPDDVPISASIKVSDEAFEQLSNQEGFMPAPYLARYKWIWMDDINRLSKKAWENYIAMAYNLVGSRLPARVRKQIGL